MEPEEFERTEPEEEPKKYYIDMGWFEQNQRSFRVVAEKRFCPGCKAKLGTETEERLPTIDSKTGRVVYETHKVAFGSNPLSVIRSCCARERNYITSDMPVLEALFRVFLLNGNQPVELEVIREELSQWFPLTSRPHGYSTQLLRRLIEADNNYGLSEFVPQPVQ
jgi:hypothetical protein